MKSEKALESRQILAVGCTKKTVKTREILKSMWNTMECERDDFSDLENVFHMLVIVFFTANECHFLHIQSQR